MGPHTPAHEADCDSREDHERVAEEGLAGEGWDDLADNPEAGQDQDVHLGMAEDPEQVLPEQRVGTHLRVKEVGTEVPVE